MKSFITLIAGSLFAVQASAAPLSKDPKHIASQWYEAFARHDAKLLEDILAPSWVDIPSPPGTPHGPEAAKAAMAMLVAAFPDFDIKIDDLIQEGGKVVVRSTITGTQRETFAGLPATSRSMKIQAVDIHEIENGKIVRTWHTEDWMTGLRELGHLPR
ncbi:ester cyclase [Mesorhizobium sp. B2-4-6]|uniref:ester cyclase n=1 Tax=Mesorhizobium sp. B2-4-6 TaxID=2589943 RepID=UPI00112A1ED3|nr:ester cyclase [Mesorhizobium sp. B2-4-6]TPL36009.1 ester cyclase [Mesorhizobium sp. B2-4-6]